MIFGDVRRQLEEVYRRAISTGISVKQHYPAVNRGAVNTIGALNSNAAALKNVPYSDIYEELESNNQYHIKLPDGGLLIFQYTFDNQDVLLKHRLGYFPCPILPSQEEAPDLYARDELYGDLIAKRIVRFPIRFDFDPICYRPVFHAHSHMTLGQFENCRIPASHPLPPNTFLNFIVRNFYFQMYKKNQNVFERRSAICTAVRCIQPPETRVPFLSVS